MIARELISPNLPELKCSDIGQRAINMMESFKVSHLPLVREQEYLGLISDKDIYDLEMEMCRLGEATTPFFTPFVRVNQHIYEVIQKVQEYEISVLPVLEMNDDYFGSILVSELSKSFAKLVAVNEPGAVIVLELSPVNYSLSQIAQIVESNDAKVLSLYSHVPKDSKVLEITLKVNVTDISSVIETFVRYDYTIKAVYMDDSLLNKMYSERYDLFMKYMNL